MQYGVTEAQAALRTPAGFQWFPKNISVVAMGWKSGEDRIFQWNYINVLERTVDEITANTDYLYQT